MTNKKEVERISLKKNFRGQISTEYLIVVGFIVFLIISLIGFAFLYVGDINDKIKSDQAQKYANKIISSAEEVYYSGEPSKVTINVFVPSAVESIEIIDDNIVMNISLNSGSSLQAFKSAVSIEGNLTSGSGVKKMKVTALSDRVLLEELE